MPGRHTRFLATFVLASIIAGGSWYWPTGTEDFQGRSGWWDYRARNRSWHMAQDMPTAVGAPVYAVGDGLVLESKAAAGYGWALVILHEAADGKEFKRSTATSGTLVPRHAAGSRTVVLRFQRRSGSGTWTATRTVPATNHDAGDATRYAAKVRLERGTWRVRAETAADSLHAATVTGWSAITVR